MGQRESEGMELRGTQPEVPAGRATAKRGAPADLLQRTRTHFVLWRPRATGRAPALVIGVLAEGNPPELRGPTGGRDVARHAFSEAEPGLWVLASGELKLKEGVYHYWLEVDGPEGERVRVTDPLAGSVDYRVMAAGHPAAVVRIRDGTMAPCDPSPSRSPEAASPGRLANLARNERLVIYEMPTSWARPGHAGADPLERDVGTFRDVLALLDEDEPGANFDDLPEVRDEALLASLGINALELLPPADTLVKREWGYATAHHCAPDYDLGFPEGNRSPTAGADLARLVARAHEKGIRVFADMVMAFGHDPYRQVNADEFHIEPTREPESPDAWQSSRRGELRDAFGGACFRYVKAVDGYEPVSGTVKRHVPARQLMLLQLERWMNDFAIDGIRVDSVNNVASWDFLREFRDRAWQLWSDRWSGDGDGASRFMVVGEELAVPLALVRERRLDALWNEHFQRLARAALLGEGDEGNDLEWTIRKAIDSRQLGFERGTEAVNYLTSHDVEGWRKERLHDFLAAAGVGDVARRAKLGFACLLTAVGIPMILAGEEFLDTHDRGRSHPDKQRDPVNYGRIRDPWRRDVYEYVRRLVALRTSSAGLASDEVRFPHVDFDEGRRVICWTRGTPGTPEAVVVVANFSDVGSTGLRYAIRGWPATPDGYRWREVTQQRDVPADWAGQEPVYPWEAKVYALVRAGA